MDETPKASIENDTTAAPIEALEDIAPSTAIKEDAPIEESDDVTSSTAIKEPIWLPDQLSEIADDTQGTTMTESDAQDIAEQISVLAVTTGATISDSDHREIADLLGTVPLVDEFASTDTSICEDAIEEWKEVVRSKSSGSSSKTAKGSDSNSTTERVRTRGEVLASSSNSEDILDRQRLIKDQQTKKLEEQRAKQSKKNLQKKTKKESKKMQRLAPGRPNIKKHTPQPKGIFQQACGMMSPAKYAKSDSESDSSSSYKHALLSVPSIESNEDNSTSDSDPGNPTLVTLEPKGKPKEDPNDASEHEQPPDFRQAGS
jgi:hypothetical protein